MILHLCVRVLDTAGLVACNLLLACTLFVTRLLSAVGIEQGELRLNYRSQVDECNNGTANLGRFFR